MAVGFAVAADLQSLEAVERGDFEITGVSAVA